MALNRPSREGGETRSTRPPHADPGEFGGQYPALAEALSSASWSDGTPKRPARLSLSIYGGRWIGQLDLIGAGVTLRVELPDVLLLYDCLEAALSVEQPAWAASEYVPLDAPKRSKKG